MDLASRCALRNVRASLRPAAARGAFASTHFYKTARIRERPPQHNGHAARVAQTTCADDRLVIRVNVKTSGLFPHPHTALYRMSNLHAIAESSPRGSSVAGSEPGQRVSTQARNRSESRFAAIVC
jgi:hypothetical protein